MKKGFTFIEVMTVIGIFAVIMTIAFYFFSPMIKKEALEKDIAGLTAIVREARNLSVASKNASRFGIHLESSKAVLFEGSTYTPGGPNEKTFSYSKNIYMSAYSLNSGGQDIIFNRLNGNTPNFGTITLSLSDNSTSTTITILSTGVVK